MLPKRPPRLVLLSLLVGASLAFSAPINAQSRGLPPLTNVDIPPHIPFSVIKARIDRIIGGRMIGVDYDAPRYFMRYERGSEIIDVVVDARTGKILNGRERM